MDDCGSSPTTEKEIRSQKSVFNRLRSVFGPALEAFEAVGPAAERLHSIPAALARNPVADPPFARRCWFQMAAVVWSVRNNVPGRKQAPYNELERTAQNRDMLLKRRIKPRMD